ncbi:MAG TPA: hypothetical protein VGF53_09340 [Pseudolabrys sp.]|jgi:hypothetical protein
MCRRIVNWLHDSSAEPDFKPIVERSIALFGVFTGVALSFYIKDFLFAKAQPGAPPLTPLELFPFWSKLLVVAAVISLLLRYIVGSAVHLNAIYVPKVTLVGREAKDGEDTVMALTEEKELKSTKLGRLFFDIIVLVAFGILGVSIIYADTLDIFMWRSAYFVLAGFLWGFFAFCFREEDRAIAKRWMLIDGFQLLITFGLIYETWFTGTAADYGKIVILAVVYVGCLLADFAVVSRPRLT